MNSLTDIRYFSAYLPRGLRENSGYTIREGILRFESKIPDQYGGRVVSILKQLNGVGMISTVFEVPENEVLQIVEQNSEGRDMAMAFFIKALNLYEQILQERYINLDENKNIRHIPKARFFRILEGFIQLLENRKVPDLYYQRVGQSMIVDILRVDWIGFRDCLIQVTDPYYGEDVQKKYELFEEDVLSGQI